MLKTMLLIAAYCLLSACSSYGSFYSPIPGQTPELIAETRAGPAPDKPLVQKSANPDASLDQMLKQGYYPIGYSSFTSALGVADSSAISQGKAVGADLVLILDRKFAGSTTTSVPVVTPTTSTSQTTGSATVFGPGGVSTVQGNATTTTYGNQTSYVPLNIANFEYGAVYLVKRRLNLGAMYRELNDEERRQYESNKAVIVTAIIDGSPAYQGNLLVGDVVIAVNRVPVSGMSGMSELIKANAGKRVEFTVVRSRALRAVDITIGE